MYLMSPLTVSQTLPLRQIYDLVVIDEASQMKSELAIGALARSNQVIIVGDQNQLPPTRVLNLKQVKIMMTMISMMSQY